MGVLGAQGWEHLWEKVHAHGGDEESHVDLQLDGEEHDETTAENDEVY